MLASPAMARLTGVRAEQLVGRRLDDLVAPQLSTRLPALWWVLLDGGLLVLRAVVLLGPYGRAFEVRAVAGVEPGRHALDLVPLARSGGVPVWSSDRRLLSGREVQVLELVARGVTSPEIAALLQLSEATVQTHVRRAIDALGARNRTHAVALAVGRGLVEPPRA